MGAFPEKVDGDGEPRSAAPLGWTEALVVLALAAEEEPLPVPPAPEDSSGGAGEPLPIAAARR
ncbi:MAG: hypothetical protein LC704_00740 [Actinobacteria bacterium]|nr:hypothetical protein [Actinomycetota bacterium]